MYYSNINKFDIANGEGIRVSLFVSGCKFYCQDCFNPEAWDFNYGKQFTEETFDEIIELVRNPNVDGLSILGGDPLWQKWWDICDLIELCESVHKLNKTVWIWSGFTWERIFLKIDPKLLGMEDVVRKELISNCDVWIDGQFNKDLKNLRLKWCGSSNQRVIDVEKSLQSNKAILYTK